MTEQEINDALRSPPKSISPAVREYFADRLGVREKELIWESPSVNYLDWLHRIVDNLRVGKDVSWSSIRNACETSQADCAIGHAVAPSLEKGLDHPKITGQYERELVCYHDSEQYLIDQLGVVARAESYLEKQDVWGSKDAVVFDIDETALSNWPQIISNNFKKNLDGPCSDVHKAACGFNAWAKLANDEPIVPTLDLYRRARSKGVTVFFVTARDKDLRDRTIENLITAGYAKWWIGLRHLLPGVNHLDRELRMNDDCSHPGPSAADCKSEIRSKIENDYTIILNVGDQKSDLVGGDADETFKLPNPFYVVP